MDTNNNTFFQSVFNRRMVICMLIGFTSGLPLYILMQLVPVWLKKEGVSLEIIGLFTLTGMPYVWKFLWAPLIDHYSMPFLGNRRGWMITTQVGILICVAVLGMFNPTNHLYPVAFLCGCIAFLSASQDIVLDAYRREILPDNELGLGNSLYVNAYRIAGLIPGSLSLILADHLPWDVVFLVTGLFMIAGIGFTLSVSEPSARIKSSKSFAASVVDPFKEFFQRQGMSNAIQILLFMLLYKIGDSMATALSTTFYLEMDYTLTEIGLIAKNAGLWSSIIGGIIGGLVMIKIGINRSLWIFGVIQMASILGFAYLSTLYNPGRWELGLVIAFEYLGVGLGTAAFVAFIARTTSIRHTATQLALFTALTALPRTIVNSSTGYLATYFGWTQFFLICTLLAIPGMLLLARVAPWNGGGSGSGMKVKSEQERRISVEET